MGTRHSLLARFLFVASISTGCGGTEYFRLRSSSPTQDAGSTIDESGTVRKNILARQGGTISLNETGDAALSDVLVSIPAGALSIDTEVSVTESTAVANQTTFSELGISTAVAAGPAIAVEAQDMDALTGSLQISLPYQSASLRLSDDITQFAVIGVYRKYGKMFAETYVGSELSVGAKTIDVSVRNFGSFQAIRVRENLSKQSVETKTSYLSRAQARAAGADGYTAFLVQNMSNLPSCDSTRISHLYYVISASSFYTCDGSAWGSIDIKGEKGDRGEDGTDGTGSSGSSGYFVRDASGYDMGNLVSTSLPWEPVVSSSSAPIPQTNRYLLHHEDLGIYYGVDSLGNIVAPTAYQSFSSSDCSGTANGAYSLWGIGTGTLIEVGSSRYKINSGFPTIKSTHINGECLQQLAYPIGKTSTYSSSEFPANSIGIGNGRIIAHQVDSKPVIQGCADNCNNFANWRKLSMIPPAEILASARSYYGISLVASATHLFAFVAVDLGSGVGSSFKMFAAHCQYSGNSRSFSSCLSARANWSWRSQSIFDSVRANSSDNLTAFDAAVVNNHVSVVLTRNSYNSGNGTTYYHSTVASCPLTDSSVCIGSGGWTSSAAITDLANIQLTKPQINHLDNVNYLLSYFTNESGNKLKTQTSGSLTSGWTAPIDANLGFSRMSKMVRQGSVAHRAFLRNTGSDEVSLSSCVDSSCATWSTMLTLDNDQNFVDYYTHPFLLKSSLSDRLILAYSGKPASGSSARRIRIRTCDSNCDILNSWSTAADLTPLSKSNWDMSVVGAYLGSDKLSLQLLESNPNSLHHIDCSYAVNTTNTPPSLSVSCNDGVVLPNVQSMEAFTSLPDSFVPPLSLLQR